VCETIWGVDTLRFDHGFITNMAPYMMDAAPWDVTYADGYLPVAKPDPGHGAR
jgi:hypothetical protein